MGEFRCIWYIPAEIQNDPALVKLLQDGREGRLFLNGDPRPIKAAAVRWEGSCLIPDAGEETAMHASADAGEETAMHASADVGEETAMHASADAGEETAMHASADVGEESAMHVSEAAGEKLPVPESDYEELLFITATDRGLSYAKEHNMAALAYANPQYPKETRSGADFVVEGFEEIDIEDLNRVYRRWHALPWEILQTERCLIRELTIPDLKALYELYDDDEIRRFVEPLYDFEEECSYERAYIDSMYRFYGYGMWLVFEKKTGKLIGRAGLEHREFPEGLEIEMGYLIARPYRRQGFATEICRGIMKYARESLGILKINCLIRRDNLPSIGLAEKTGFTCVGESKLDETMMLRFVAEL